MSFRIARYSSTTRTQFEEDFSSVIPQLDIYYLPAFLTCDARMQGGEYEIFTVRSEKGVWIYPYILLPIPNSEWFDVGSPYGYAGPFCTDPELCEFAEKALLESFKERAIVTEFVRYHYAFNGLEDQRFAHNCTNLENRTIVVLDTAQSTDVIWEQEFSGTNRNLVRKLEKEDYTFHFRTFQEANSASFQAMYAATMQNANASDFYYFDAAFYSQLIAELGDQLKIATVEKEGVIFSTALFFLSGPFVTYYLSARNLDYPKVTASNFLLSKVAFWAAENGFKTLNFGGGLSNDPTDRLFKFKRNFSTKTASFYIGKRIHDSEKYAQLVLQFQQEHGVENYERLKHILQFYR